MLFVNPKKPRESIITLPSPILIIPVALLIVLVVVKSLKKGYNKY
jgi:hypothetical protein